MVGPRHVCGRPRAIPICQLERFRLPSKGAHVFMEPGGNVRCIFNVRHPFHSQRAHSQPDKCSRRPYTISGPRQQSRPLAVKASAKVGLVEGEPSSCTRAGCFGVNQAVVALHQRSNVCVLRESRTHLPVLDGIVLSNKNFHPLAKNCVNDAARVHGLRVKRRGKRRGRSNARLAACSRAGRNVDAHLATVIGASARAVGRRQTRKRVGLDCIHTEACACSGKGAAVLTLSMKLTPRGLKLHRYRSIDDILGRGESELQLPSRTRPHEMESTTKTIVIPGRPQARNSSIGFAHG